MTEPSQYFKGRTIQEQMDEVIGYVDKRAEEVAAAKADAVLQPAEQAKTAAQAAAVAAEAAKDTTLAALPEIRQDISGLKAEDVALDGRLDTVELKVTTAEGNIVTIQGQIVALQNVQGDYVKKAGADQTVTSRIMVPTTATGTRDTQIANGTRIQNDLDAYVPMVRDTGNKEIAGNKTFKDNATMGANRVNITNTGKWKRMFTTPKRSGGIVRTWVFAYAGPTIANTYAALLQMCVSGSNDVPTLTWLVKGSAVPADSVASTVYDGMLNIWVSKSCALSCIGYSTRAKLEGALLTAIDEADEYDEPLSDDGFAVKYGTVVG